MNQKTQAHQMVVKNTFPSGAQEWYCPTCGRHFIIQWPPCYKRIILVPGDEQAAHAGGTEDLTLGVTLIPPEPTPPAAPPDSTPDDPYLAPWRDWYEKKGGDDSLDK